MIDFPIVDTHLHVWDTNHLSYAWLDDIPLLNKPYLLDDYDQACGSVQVERMVFVQCEVDTSQYRLEADWVTRLAAKDSRIQAIIPWAPLENGEYARTEVTALAENKLVKGIRRIIQFEDDPAFCLQREFIDGVQMLSEFDLHFEICIKGDDQFRNTIALVRECPDVRFMLNHVGKPFIKEGVSETWKTLLKELSELPNTWCKMSGLVTEADVDNWTPEQLHPYIDWVLDCFGFDRTVFGGDWPVCLLATTYPRWIETLGTAIADAPASDVRKLLYDNAVDFYRLEES